MDADSGGEGRVRMKAAVDGALAVLEGVEGKGLFGSEGYFVGGNLFAQVRRDGRLGLRLPSAGVRKALLALPGAEAWCVAGAVQDVWVLVPSSLHADPAALREWARRAWSQARERPARTSVTGRKEGRRVVRAVFPRLD